MHLGDLVRSPLGRAIARVGGGSTRFGSLGQLLAWAPSDAMVSLCRDLPLIGPPSTLLGARSNDVACDERHCPVTAAAIWLFYHAKMKSSLERLAEFTPNSVIVLPGLAVMTALPSTSAVRV